MSTLIRSPPPGFEGDCMGDDTGADADGEDSDDDEPDDEDRADDDDDGTAFASAAA